MEIVRTGVYAASLKRLGKLGATEAEIGAMESSIASAPDTGDIVPGMGGIRKVRFGFGGRGKRGGGRTLYYALAADETVYLLVAYAKVDKADLTAAEKKLFVKLVRELTDD